MGSGFPAIFTQSRIVLFQSNVVLLQNNRVLFQNKSFLFQSNGVLLQSNRVLILRNIVLSQKKSCLFHRNVFLFQHKSFLIQSNGVLVQNDSFLGHNKVVLFRTKSFLAGSADAPDGGGVREFFHKVAPAMLAVVPRTVEQPYGVSRILSVSTTTMKRQPVQVSLKFARLKKDETNSFTILVIVCLGKYVTLFPNLPVTLIALSALQATYQEAMNAATIGDPKDTEALKDAYNDLIVALRLNAAYIQSLNLTAAQVLLSGYDVVVYSRR